MVFSPDLNPEDGGFRRRRGHRQRPKTGFSSKNGKGFTEDIWNFDDSWFTATQCRGRLDVFGELLWELVRLQSLLDYLLGGDMTPSDDRHRSSRRRDASDPRRPRARSTHGPPRPESYGADADFVSGLLLSRQTKNRRRDASVPRVSSKDCDDSSRASASGEEHGNKEEKGWRTLTRELRKLLSSKFSDKDTDCGDEDSQSADSSPRLTRRAGSVQPNRSGANQTNVTVTKFRPRNFEPRVVREIPIRRLNSTESASASTTWIGPASATSAEEARRSARVENRKSYPKYSKPPQPQRATTYFVPPQQTSDPLFAAFASASPHSRPNSFSHTSSAKVIFHPIFQTGVPHSDTFSSSHAPRPDDDDGLPPVIITEITEEEAEEIARKQRRERRKPEEGKKGESANEEYTTKSTPVRVRCELCLASLRIGSGNDMALSCNHLFHSQCILEWLSRKSTCPVCQELIIKD